MAVLVKDVKDFPKDAPTKELLLDKHIDFLSKYGQNDTNYDLKGTQLNQ